MNRLRIEVAGILLMTLALAFPLAYFLYGAIVCGVLPIVLIGLMILAGEPIHQLRLALRNRGRA